MKYIGNKTRLLDFISESIETELSIESGTFCDIFSGTGSVGYFFKTKGFQIISNDFMTYSFVMQKAMIEQNQQPSFLKLVDSYFPKSEKFESEDVLSYLNNLKGKKGYAFENYCPSGESKRQYFTDENGMMIDAIREEIQSWKHKELITENEYYYLLASLINAADHIANMSGTYGAYLKIWRSVALKKIKLLPIEIYDNKKENKVFQQDANELITSISGDILYLDPPYNSRQYAPNFHVLESIAVWDKQELKGKTGLRNYDDQKSMYSQKSNALTAFEDLIEKANFKNIVLSYNNEGIIPPENIREILSKKGELTIYDTTYRRFRTERDHENRKYKDVGDKTTEYLYIVKT